MERKVRPGKIDYDQMDKKRFSYPLEWQRDEYEVEFEVKEYHIAENDKGERVILPLSERVVNDYNPFIDPEIVWTAYKVNPSSEKSIIAFCNKYGLFRPNDLFDQDAPYFLSVDSFSKKIIGIQMIVDLHENIIKKDERALLWAKEYFIKVAQEKKDQDLHRLDELIVKAKDISAYNSVNQIRELEERINSYFEQAKSLSAVKIAREFLIREINEQVKFVYPVMRIGENGFLPGYTSKSLLAVIYHHIYNMVEKGQFGARCDYCGSPFTPRKTGSKFCPPGKANGSSKCKNNYNQMKLKARAAIYSGEKTIDEVCSERKRLYQEVLSWLDETKIKH
jgi:hypothetical protein